MLLKASPFLYKKNQGKIAPCLFHSSFYLNFLLHYRSKETAVRWSDEEEENGSLKLDTVDEAPSSSLPENNNLHLMVRNHPQILLCLWVWHAVLIKCKSKATLYIIMFTLQFTAHNGAASVCAISPPELMKYISGTSGIDVCTLDIVPVQ